MRKQILSFALALCLSALCLPGTASGTSPAATPTASSVFVDGKKTVFDTYNIKGSNYFKLRDLAYTLSGTPKQFDVGWDIERGAIILTTGKPYKIVGGEMKSGDGGSKYPTPAKTKVILDGKEIIFNAYIIGGLTYFKLRDVGAAMDFGVEWDGSRNAIVINTSEGYKAETILGKSENMGQTYLDSIVFLGDSTTYGFQVYGVLSDGTRTKQVWTPADRTFSLFNQKNIKIYYPDTKESMSIESAVLAKKPEYMVITLGINGVASMGETEFKRDYSALVTRILEANPDTKIILNSIFPVARNYSSLRSINNEKIESANGWVLSVATDLGVRYLDSASVLKDSEGWLMPKYEAGDGLHLKPDAYKAILQYISTHGYI